MHSDFDPNSGAVGQDMFGKSNTVGNASNAIKKS
jgi:hypothetical protein